MWIARSLFYLHCTNRYKYQLIYAWFSMRFHCTNWNFRKKKTDECLPKVDNQALEISTIVLKLMFGYSFIQPFAVYYKNMINSMLSTKWNRKFWPFRFFIRPCRFVELDVRDQLHTFQILKYIWFYLNALLVPLTFSILNDSIPNLLLVFGFVWL